MVASLGPLATIQRAFLAGAFEVTLHFLEEMRNDVLFFVDIEHAILGATSADPLDVDRAGHPQYEVVGSATDGRSVGIICSLRTSDDVLLITVYETKERI